MRKTIITAMLLFAAWRSEEASGAAQRFIKVSDHCYYLQSNERGENVGAVVTDDGVLLINPPQDPDLRAVLEALAAVTAKTVRWIVFTDPGLNRNADTRNFAERNALILTSAGAWSLAPPESARQNPNAPPSPTPGRFIFEGQMHLFASNAEVRILALQNKARTGGDVVVLIPAEKVLFSGGLYEAAQYPDIDTVAGGSAVGWIDGVKQVIDAVPVLKQAIPAAKPLSKAEQEKTLEESITVISSRGEASNLQNVKDLLESCRKLRNDISRAVKAGRTADGFLASSASDPYRSYGNLDAYAMQLFEALSK